MHQCENTRLFISTPAHMQSQRTRPNDDSRKFSTDKIFILTTGTHDCNGYIMFSRGFSCMYEIQFCDLFCPDWLAPSL